jgi:hypothetical protein
VNSSLHIFDDGQKQRPQDSDNHVNGNKQSEFFYFFFKVYGRELLWCSAVLWA